MNKRSSPYRWRYGRHLIRTVSGRVLPGGVRGWNKVRGAARQRPGAWELRLAWPLASLMLGETLMGSGGYQTRGRLGRLCPSRCGRGKRGSLSCNYQCRRLDAQREGLHLAYLGAGASRSTAYRYAVVGVSMGFALGALFSLALCNMAPIMLLCGITPELITPTTAYLEAPRLGHACGLRLGGLDGASPRLGRGPYLFVGGPAGQRFECRFGLRAHRKATWARPPWACVGPALGPCAPSGASCWAC